MVFQRDDGAPDHNLIGPAARSSPKRFFRSSVWPLTFLSMLLFFAGWNRFWCQPLDSRMSKVAGHGTLVLTFPVCLRSRSASSRSEVNSCARAVRSGQLLASYLVSVLNPIGAFILLVTVMFAALTVATHWSLSAGVKSFRSWQRRKSAEALTAFHHFRESRRKEKLRERVVKKHAKRARFGKKKEEAQTEADTKKRKEQPVKTAVSSKSPPTPQKQELLPSRRRRAGGTLPPSGSSTHDARKYRPMKKS